MPSSNLDSRPINLCFCWVAGIQTCRKCVILVCKNLHANREAENQRHAFESEVDNVFCCCLSVQNTEVYRGSSSSVYHHIQAIESHVPVQHLVILPTSQSHIIYRTIIPSVRCPWLPFISKSRPSGGEVGAGATGDWSILTQFFPERQKH